MNIAEKHDRFLRWAEMQLLFVQHAKSALYSRNSATGEMGALPTDKFCGWTYGAHAMSKDELTLDFDDATMAAAALEHTVTMNLAVWIRHAFQDSVRQLQQGRLCGRRCLRLVRFEVPFQSDRENRARSCQGI